MTTRTVSRAPASRRTLAALILLGVAVAVLASLGRWQLSRADERQGIRQAIEAGRRQPPVALSADTPAEALQPWRPASASGRWRDDLTVLVDNRNLDGRPGLWVATPLQQADGGAVLVLRGWLPRLLGDAELAVPAGEPGEQQIAGELASRVPRLFELPTLGGERTADLPSDWPGRGGVIPRVQNLDMAALSRSTGLPFIPAVLMQTAATPDDGLVRDWPQPSVDADQNIGYAIQWFGFAVIAGIAWVVVAARALRRRSGDNGGQSGGRGGASGSRPPES